MTKDESEDSNYTRRTVVRATVGGLAAGLAATPAAANNGRGNGKGRSSDPVIDSLTVSSDGENRVVADYTVSDDDGDLDRVDLVVGNPPRKVVAHVTEDISGDETSVSGLLVTDPLPTGRYGWAFVVTDERNNFDKDKGKVTVG